MKTIFSSFFLIFIVGCGPSARLIKEPGVWGKLYLPEKKTNAPILHLGGSDGAIDEKVLIMVIPCSP